MTRNYLAIFFSFILCFGFLNGQEVQPNFVLIVADDLGYGDLGITGSYQIKTPHIDQLARDGVFFQNGYVSSAVCSPSRAGFLTGVNQVEFGHDNNLAENQPGFDPAFLGMPVSQPTIANYLDSLGYVNGLVGKWHLGEADKFHPLNRGFHEFWGYLKGGHDYFSAKPDGKGYSAPLISNYKEPQAITYLTDDKGDECVDFIKRHKAEPFFLFASFNAPHTPMQATEDDLELYKHIKNKKRRTYTAMVHRLDVNVGRIVEAIEQAGLSENTLIVFISDNGGPASTNASINAPYNGSKGTLLEGGIHVPFIMKWTGKISPNSIYESAVSSLDLAPTFIELAGGKENLEGVNLIPFVNNPEMEDPHANLKWKFTISAAIREGEWKLIRLPDRMPVLYHLPSDLAEQNDVALKNLDITQRLMKKLGDWDVNLPHPVFLEGAIWKPRQLSLYDKKYIVEQPK
ncbi:sulfatase-like hydrolase/transferase [Portibacter lacus]|uniref:N-acetylgalactosamine-6-sulfatase n=1 Tax=Portibacter lacus TaxID=1099794 RepID=A0AA37SS30_9BACT|nr:sulfatase-like hydrolase/transferase [Portibacter lacus]GLR19463.1 N-acetylgalactosamine-6-sulfatase [Portibacter lacus]